MSLRRPPAPNRIVADVPIDKRETLLVERLDTGKVRFWRCSRTPEGRTVFTSAIRTSSIQRHLLGRVWPVLRDLDADDRALELKRAS